MNSDKYDANDGPLGKAPEISVGVSDAVLVAVSSIGFAFLAWTVYSIILTKVKSARELEQDAEEFEKSFEERLAQADVSTLNRAQRRARARHIMKQQRRVMPEDGEGDEDLHEQQQALIAEVPQEEAIPPFQEDTYHNTTARHLSRKERTRAAKQIELAERRLLEDERRKEQLEALELARRKKKERERLLAIQAEEERKLRQQQRTESELAAYTAWRTFLPVPSKDDNTPSNNNSITVKEWVKELKRERIVSLKDLSNRFEVSEEQVRKRILDLVSSSRVSGILEKDERFIYLSPKDLSILAAFVKTREKKMTPQEIADHIQELLSRRLDCKTK
jgi:hypothetical protein